MKNIKLWIKALAVTIVLGGVATPAMAHTISVTTLNAGAPGSVTIWLGSYHATSYNQGAISVGGGPATAFNLISSTLPSGAVLGVSQFYADCSPYQGCPGAPGLFNSTTNTTGQTISGWQGVTLSGLTAGTHSYTISGMTSLNWMDWNSGQTNWTGQITITAEAAGVPEPITLALTGMGIVAVGASRRRKSLI